jgi:PAS domain S-box-containing protein
MSQSDQSETKILKSRYIPTAEFYSQVIDSLQDYSIFTVDMDLLINSWNSGASKIFGYETDEIVGRHFEVIFTEEDRQKKGPAKEIETAGHEGRALDNKWHVRKDGSQFYAQGLVFPLTGIDNEMLGYVKILRDVTERKRSEDSIKQYVKELEELNTHKASILAILSHDLRSPLTGIIGTAEYLSANFHRMKAEEVKEMLDLLHKSASDELTMLDYLVEWARVKYASEVFSHAKLKLTKSVNKVFDMLNETASTGEVMLHSEIEEHMELYADEKMLHSILQNIVSNAIKHTDSGGKITISARHEGEKVLIEVKDTGIGMPQDVLEKLFVPQIDTLSSSRVKNKGAGIGLLLVKGFLEKNDGKIWVESTVGEGSTFYFTIPIKNPDSPASALD